MLIPWRLKFPRQPADPSQLRRANLLPTLITKDHKMIQEADHLSNAIDAPPAPLDYTGERMVPDAPKQDLETFWEHIYRYNFASRFASGRNVLDIACGEGYGTATLKAAGAKSVIGVDISPEAVEHAKKKYGLDMRVGSAEEIPLANDSIDLLVSFETIEHVPHPERMLDECRRVCSPGGTVIISTPNTEVYGDTDNPFHCSELTINEFLKLIEARFKDIRLYTQRPTFAPWWNPRVIAARDSLWRRIRGTGRGFEWVRRLLIPGLFPRQKPDPIQAALNPPKGFDVANPFIIQPASLPAVDKPTYALVVATA